MTTPPRPAHGPVAVLTVLALLAFAGNSLLCRFALLDRAIDPMSFTAIRLGSGALALTPLAWSSRRARQRWSARGAACLFTYALCFSLAYVSLDTGTGALLLFGAVQLTMLGVGFWRGERPGGLSALGILMAVGGLVAMLLPGATAPGLDGTALMLTAGIAWGAYSLVGRTTTDITPTQATARNFVLAAPLALALPLLTLDDLFCNARGVGLALASGVLTSALGYALWYAALPRLSATTAATAQLTVPVLAAVLGSVVLAEPWTTRLVGCGLLVLTGVALALRQPRTSSR